MFICDALRELVPFLPFSNNVAGFHGRAIEEDWQVSFQFF